MRQSKSFQGMKRRWTPIGAATMAVAVVAAAAQAQETARLTSSDVAAGDQLGSSVGIDGSVAVVGAVLGDGAVANSGSAYVFSFGGGSWSQTAELNANDGAAGDEFGRSAAVDGTTIVVGAPGDENFDGAAYVFTFNGTTWTQAAKLVSGEAIADNEFGRAVAIDGGVIAVGASQFSGTSPNDTGAVYVFRESGGSWLPEQKLTASDGASFDLFGESVAVSGNTIVVGARLSGGTNAGAAYVFTFNGSTWSEQEKLTASDAAVGDQFGTSVALSGSRAIVGAPLDDDIELNSGSVYVFEDSSGWSQTAKLTASFPEPSAQLGQSVGLSGDRAVVGAINAFGVGSLFTYAHSGGSWTEDAILFVFDVEANVGDQLGGAVGTDGTNAIAGAIGFDANSLTNAGSAFIFAPPPIAPPAPTDTDGDGLLDSTEIMLQADFPCLSITDPDSDGDGLSDGDEVLTIGTNPCSTDTDNDGLADAEDPTPTDPGAPGDFLEELARDAADSAVNLSLATIDAPNSNAAKGRRNAMANKLTSAANSIAAGDYDAAIATLQDLLDKIDGVSPPPDWMVDGPEKTALRMDVELLISLLLSS